MNKAVSSAGNSSNGSSPPKWSEFNTQEDYAAALSDWMDHRGKEFGDATNGDVKPSLDGGFESVEHLEATIQGNDYIFAFRECLKPPLVYRYLDMDFRRQRVMSAYIAMRPFSLLTGEAPAERDILTFIEGPLT